MEWKKTIFLLLFTVLLAQNIFALNQTRTPVIYNTTISAIADLTNVLFKVDYTPISNVSLNTGVNLRNRIYYPYVKFLVNSSILPFFNQTTFNISYTLGFNKPYWRADAGDYYVIQDSKYVFKPTFRCFNSHGSINGIVINRDESENLTLTVNYNLSSLAFLNENITCEDPMYPAGVIIYDEFADLTQWTTASTLWSSDGVEAEGTNCDAGPGGTNLTTGNLDLTDCSANSVLVRWSDLDSGAIESTDCLKVSNSSDGGVTWSPLATVFCDDSNSEVQRSHSLPAASYTANFRWRFTCQGVANSEQVRVVSFNVTCTDIRSPQINASLDITSPVQTQRVNMTANVTDGVGLSYCQFIDNQSLANGAKTYINKSLTNTHNQCSQNYTIRLGVGSVINFTVIVNDTTGIKNFSQQLITVAPFGKLLVSINTPLNNSHFNQYDNFTLSATLNCTGTCGDIVAYALYNTSGETPNSNISINKGTVPLFIQNQSSNVNPCVNLTNTGDSYVDVGDPNANNGGGTLLILRDGPSGAIRYWVKFDATSIPVDATVSNATLFVDYTAIAGADPVGKVVEVTNTSVIWDESTITWNNQPTGDITSLSTAVIPSTFQWMQWDVLSNTQNAIAKRQNASFLAFFTIEGGGTEHQARFDSKEATFPPYLTVCYSSAVIVNSTPTLKNMVDNQFNVSWIVNITGLDHYNVAVKFNSSYGENLLPPNNTGFNRVCVGSCAAVDSAKPVVKYITINNTAQDMWHRLNISANITEETLLDKWWITNNVTNSNTSITAISGLTQNVSYSFYIDDCGYYNFTVFANDSSGNVGQNSTTLNLTNCEIQSRANITLGNGDIGTAWTNPRNANRTDDNKATASLAGGATSKYLNATNFSFSIPSSNTTISGIKLLIEKSEDAAASNIQDSNVKFISNYTIKAGDYALPNEWSTSDTNTTYAGYNEDWGEIWAVSDVNNQGFGVMIKVEDNGASAGVASIDSIQLAVFYNTTTPTEIIILKVLLNNPPNYSNFVFNDTNTSVLLNASVISSANNALDIFVWGANSTEQLQAGNNSLLAMFKGVINTDGGYNLTYNWTSPLIQPSDKQLLLLHFDNRSEFAENESFFNDFSGHNSKANCTLCPLYNFTNSKFGGSMEFDGVNDFINISNPDILTLGNSSRNFTMSAWIYIRGNTTGCGFQTIFGTNNVDGSSSQIYTLNTRHNQIGYNRFEPSGGAAESTLNITKDVWHHVAVNPRDGENIVYFWLDGNNQSVPYTETYSAANLWTSATIGSRSPSAGCFFNGTIDEFSLWNRSLSHEEIIDLYRLKNQSDWFWKVNATNPSDLTSAENRTFQFNISSPIYGAPPPSTTCDCPVAGNWEINDGSICELSTICDIRPNKLIINNGGLRILSGGRMRTDGCYSCYTCRLYVDSLGGLFCKG